MCFGGGSDKSSKQMVQMQKDEAAAARQKEADRQDRINSGLARISAAFEGSPVMGSRAKSYTFSGVPTGTTSGAAVSGMPGFTYKRVGTPATAATQGTPTYNTGGGHDFGPSGGTSYSGTGRAGDQGTVASGNSGAHSSLTGTGRGSVSSNGTVSYSGGTPATAGNQRWVMVGPDGKEYEVGQSGSWNESYDTGGRSGGINDAFYNKYKQGIVDYYMPQVGEKFKDAKDELTFRLARAGLLRSSMANTETTDLSKQNTLAEAKVRNDADTATADLRSRVAAEKQKAVNQLYATEDPDVAANQATAAISNITSEQPTNTPLGDIFSIAAIGGANALKGYSSEKFKQKIPGYQKSTSVVG